MELVAVVRRAADTAADEQERSAFVEAFTQALEDQNLPVERDVWLPDHQGAVELNCGDAFDVIVRGEAGVMVATMKREAQRLAKRMPEALARLGLNRGLVILLGAEKKNDRYRLVLPALSKTGA